MAVAVWSSFEQFMDDSGDPLSGGSITVYLAGTVTLASVFSNKELSTPAANPIPLNSAGRHENGIMYIDAIAYKTITKNSGGTTITNWSRDNIDPGVPLGSGALAIANGGTSATSAGAALTALGGATAAEVAAVAADVAALSGSLASVEKTHIATGTTAQRPITPVEGDIRRNTTTARWEGYVAGWQNFLTDTEGAATQAEMESASSSVKFVSPARLINHPLVAKAYALFSQAGAHSLITQIAVTSIADGGVGLSTLTWTSAFASGDYVIVGSISQSDAAGGFITCVPTNATSANIQCRNTSGTATDFTKVSVVAFGDT